MHSIDCTVDYQRSLSSKPMKTILLYGVTGAGKSSFVNCLCSRYREDNLVAPESRGSSCSSRTLVYGIHNHPVLGNIAVMDTVGLNDNTDLCSNEDISKMILEYCFNKKDDYVLDAILYFSQANTSRMNFNKEIKEFCEVFKSSVAEVKKSVIWILTFANEFKNLKKLKATIDEMNTEKLFIVLWDSKDPLENQVHQLNSLLDKIDPFLVSTTAYSAEIVEVAIALQKSDQIPSDHLTTKEVSGSCTCEFTHIENQSSFGIFNIISFGITKLLSKRRHTKREMLLPKYPEGALNRRIANITYTKQSSKHVCDWKLEIDNEDVDENKRYQRTIRSEMEVEAVMFGYGKVVYTVNFEYIYDMALNEEATIWNDRHELSYYMPEATNIFFYDYLNQPKTSKFMDKIKKKKFLSLTANF